MPQSPLSPLANHLKRKLLCLALLCLYKTTLVQAEDMHLPVSPNPENPNHTISDLTVPSNHHGINVGAASGTYSTDGTTLTIDQTTQNVILDWSSFNIGAGDKVIFIQPSSNSIALNDIAQADASQILGQLIAEVRGHTDQEGQIYLINSNGFVFGNGAEVNVNTLVASSLNISDATFLQGITNVINNSNSTPVAAFNGSGATQYTKNGLLEKIQILVQNGAKITASDAGRIILAAPSVTNAGTIRAPDGQVILVAASDKVYLQESKNSDLRGLLVEVKTGGDVTNLGSIMTERGNTTLLGFAVAQDKIVTASTSVALNGSVRLLARQGAQLINSSVNGSFEYLLEPANDSTLSSSATGSPQQASVVLGQNSSTSITLDDSAGLAVAGLSQPKSIVDIEAGLITMQSGANITAHGGQVDITASTSPYTSNLDFANPSLTDISATNPSRILLESGSLIDVSGSQDVQMPLTSNIINLTLYSNELRNDPYQKNGILYGQSVYVDSRTGTSLADISAAKAAQTYSVEYRNTQGGTVNLNSEGDVIVQHAATINIAGGWVDYIGGNVNYTDLVSGGVIYSMATANPNLVYQQILHGSYYENGYTQGMAAGSANITSRDVILDGQISAGSHPGIYQRSAENVPGGGQLNINTAWTGITQQDVLFQASQTDTAASSANPINSTLYLSNALFSQGLQNFSLKNGGNFSLSADTIIKLPEFGHLSLEAGAMQIAGKIIAPNGEIKLSTQTKLDNTRQLDGSLALTNSAVLDSSGLWINDIYASNHNQNLATAAYNAGSITLSAQGDLLLTKGAQLNANGGAWLQSNANLIAGSGGSISLSTAGFDQTSRLELAAQLSAYGLTQNGSLNITANSIDISPLNLSANTVSNTLDLSATFFNSGGFSAYDLTANAGNLQIEANTQLLLQQTNWQLNSQAYNQAGGSGLSAFATPYRYAENQRNAVDLSLNLSQNNNISGYDGNRELLLAEHSLLQLDAQATVNLKSDANLSINGQIASSGGTINLELNGQNGYNPDQAIRLGADAVLDVSGSRFLTQNNLGLLSGSILAGGTVNLTANRGYILLDPTSKINVAGGSGWLDSATSHGYQHVLMASAGGSINLTAAEGMLLAGQFDAAAGSGQVAIGSAAQAAAGSLAITMNAENRQEPAYDVSFPLSQREIDVSAEPQSILSSAQIASGMIPDGLNGHAYISAQQISNGDFASLKLATLVMSPQSLPQQQPASGAIVFDGDVSLKLASSLELDSPLITHDWLSSSDSGTVNLVSDQFILGSSQNQTPLNSLSDPATALNSNGQSADLTISADSISLRGASLIDHFASTALSSQGDIMLQGVLNSYIASTAAQSLAGSLATSGTLSLTAREIYPTTLTQFSITVDENLSPNGWLYINGLPDTPTTYTPYSAGGAVSLSAANIQSSENLIAPFGHITLSAVNQINILAGKLSVSDSDQIIIPYGNTQGSGKYWNYTLAADINLLSGAPQKGISLSASNINLAAAANINLNGGGDLQAYELVATAGGSIDFLSQSYQQSYAIIPSYEFANSAYDSLLNQANISQGESIHLSAAADGLAAGDYVLLPSYYALLPGAYLITPEANSAYLLSGDSTRLANGTTEVAAYLETKQANNSTLALSGWQGYAVQKGSEILNYSPYLLTAASQFFTAQNSTELPSNGGNLSLQASQSLQLNGQIAASAAANGLGGQLDISGSNFTLLQNGSGSLQNGSLQLSANQLNALGVDSILIGGNRNRTNTGSTLTVSAENVNIAANVSLKAPEIILAATNSVNIDGGAQLSASGKLAQSDTHITVQNADGSSDGALVRVSSAAQASIERANLSATPASLSLASSASLNSSGSISLNTSASAAILGTINMPGGDLSLSGALMTLGGAANSAAGLQLNAATLNNLHVANLELHSASSIDFAGQLAVQFQQLTLDAAALIDNSTQTATLNANSITLQNSQLATSNLIGNGGGLLNLNANQIILAGGEYHWQGFQQINLNATQSLTDSGTAIINSTADVQVTTPIWTAAAGANTTLDMSANNLNIIADGNASSTALGASLSINAAQINDQGNIQLTSGQLNLHSLAQLNLGNTSVINVAGEIVPLASVQEYSGGGNIQLSSSAGNINLASGARLNLSGSSLGGNAGQLTITASSTAANTGNVTLDATLQAQAYHAAHGGSFALTANQYNLAGNSHFSALNSQLAAAGFNGSLLLHQRAAGDIDVTASDTVSASSVTLTADAGRVTVAGEINTSGAQAGNIQLAGNKGVNLDSTAKLFAVSNAGHNQGGDIQLTAAPLAANANINIASGAAFNLSAAGNGNGGKLSLIVNQLGADDAPVNIGTANLTGASSLTVDIMQHDTVSSITTASLQNALNASANFLQLASSNSDLQNRLDGFSLAGGIDFVSHGDLNWNIGTDLANSVSQPGLFSIRAAGNLLFSDSLMDGFTLADNGQLALLATSSWSYNIVAGADLSSANLSDTQTVSKADLTLASGTSIHTGTGDIRLAASGNIVLSDATATVYTAGLSSNLVDAYAKYRPLSFSVQYPENGGSIQITAGGNIIGASTPQLISDWLQRSGNWNSAYSISRTNLPTAWGIDFGYSQPDPSLSNTPFINASLGFAENIGALGGGNVLIQSGANIQDLSVMLPSSAVSTIVNGNSVLSETNGGNLSVTANGNIQGGVFYVENGNANIQSAGAISGGSQYSAGPIFALGNAQFEVSAADGIAVSTVLNPFSIAQAGLLSSKTDYFTTYTANSGIQFSSLAGDLNLNNDPSIITSTLQNCLSSACLLQPQSSQAVYQNLSDAVDITALLTLYPASLTASALSGNLNVNASFSLYSAANTSFDLAAATELTFAADTVLTQLDVSPSLLLPVANPLTSFSNATAYWLPSNYDNLLSSNQHASQPVHQNDTTRNRLLAANGSIVGLVSGSTVVSAKALDISAQQNLANLSLVVQNLDSVYQDNSNISLGGELLYPTVRNTVTGDFQGSGFIQVAGPGNFNVWAAKGIDLGVSGGIVSVGNEYNTALPYTGASISLLAGSSATSQLANTVSFLDWAVSSANLNNLQQSLASIKTPSSTVNNAYLQLLSDLSTVKSSLSSNLDSNNALQLAMLILFDQLQLADSAEQTSLGKVAYDIGFNAIHTLFANPQAADIALEFSQIQTLQGGNINLLAPGGQINIGLAASDLATGKSAAELGVVAQGSGNINILAQGDIEVNQSRVFTLDGGNINIWSSNGNIDAGRGAKSAVGTQAPTANYDAFGNLILAYPPDVAGSGIRAQSAYTSQLIGNVALAAPAGVVNANEAGIAGHDLLIAAASVLGVNNFDFSGAGFGLPQAVTPIVVPDLGGTAVGASNLAYSSLNLGLLSADAAAHASLGGGNRVIWLDSQVVGFGKCSVAQVKAGVAGCGG